jgi:hypothetical protein
MFSITCCGCGVTEHFTCSVSHVEVFCAQLKEEGWRCVEDKGPASRYRCPKCPDDTPDWYDFLGIPIKFSRNRPPTALKLVNLMIFQWFFVRLARIVDSDGTHLAIMYPVVPMTGWFSDYIPRRRRYRMIG